MIIIRFFIQYTLTQNLNLKNQEKIDLNTNSNLEKEIFNNEYFFGRINKNLLQNFANHDEEKNVILYTIGSNEFMDKIKMFSEEIPKLKNRVLCFN